MAEKSTILRMEGICKDFPGVRALDHVEFQLRKGEIHSLVGENGAGKSTLIKVLTGVFPIDQGKVFLEDKEIHITSTMEAAQHGISTVYQEINLCPNLSVAENIYIGREPRNRFGIDWSAMNSGAQQLLKERMNVDIDVKRLLSSYPVAIQQMVAIARAVDISRGILILDEPTSSLDQNEVQQLFRVMKKLREQGMAIVFVTHFLDQIYEVSDRITILRNGKFIGVYDVQSLTQYDLVSKMIGKELKEIEMLENAHKSKDTQADLQMLVQAKNFGKRGLVAPFNLNIRKGEVLGLAGLLGSGRTEVASLLFGINRADHGTIQINGKEYSYIYPKKAIEEGFGYCPEDRKVEGIAAELTIRENILLAIQANRGVLRYFSMKKQQQIAQKYIELLAIKTPGMEQRIDHLSGGNQQKVILARWLATNPQLLILDEPTRGIDVGAKSEIQKLILQLAEQGMTILFISSELKEVVRCCSRVAVLRDKRVIGELAGEDITEENIMRMIAEGGNEIEQERA